MVVEVINLNYSIVSRITDNLKLFVHNEMIIMLSSCAIKISNMLCDDSIRQTYLYVAQLWKNIGGHQ